MVSVTFKGGPELARAINALSSDLRAPLLRAALTVAAEPMAARMRTLAIRGRVAPHIADNIGISDAQLRAWGSFQAGAGATTDSEGTVAVGPEKGFFYALFLEYGTANMSARPFMRPAFDETAPEVLERLGAELWKLIAAGAPAGGRK